LNANQKAKELSRNLFSQFLGQHGLPDLERELPKHLVVRLNLGLRRVVVE